jgi:hypothetical protein
MAISNCFFSPTSENGHAIFDRTVRSEFIYL